MGAQDLLMVSCNLGAVSLLLSAEDLPPSSSLHLSFQSSAILNLRVFFCPQKISCLCPSLVLRSCDCRSPVHDRSPTSVHLCTFLTLSTTLRSWLSFYLLRSSPTLPHLCAFLTFPCNLGSVGLLSVHGRSPLLVHLCTFSWSSFFET
jgi:hypothetical protein